MVILICASKNPIQQRENRSELVTNAPAPNQALPNIIAAKTGEYFYPPQTA